MSTWHFPAFYGLVYLWRSARAHTFVLISPWQARRKAKSWIRHLDNEIDRVNRMQYKRLTDWRRIDQHITSAETARTTAEEAYEAGNFDDVQFWANRGLGSLRSAKGLMPELVFQSDN